MLADVSDSWFLLYGCSAHSELRLVGKRSGKLYVPLIAAGTLWSFFLWEASEWCGFKSSIRRMQCDPEPIIRRRRRSETPTSPKQNSMCALRRLLKWQNREFARRPPARVLQLCVQRIRHSIFVVALGIQSPSVVRMPGVRSMARAARLRHGAVCNSARYE
jgi:hypothetical protein